MKFQKQWLASAAMAAVMCTVSTTSQAIEVSGTLESIGVPGVGGDLLSFSFTPGDYILSVVGSVTPTLFLAGTPVTFDFYSANKKKTILTFGYDDLPGGVYDLFLSGAVGADYKVSIFGTGTVTAVPEPESIALALAGLCVAGRLVHRRREEATV